MVAARSFSAATLVSATATLANANRLPPHPIVAFSTLPEPVSRASAHGRAVGRALFLRSVAGVLFAALELYLGQLGLELRQVGGSCRSA